MWEKKNPAIYFLSFFSLATLSQRERDSVGSPVLFRGLGKGSPLCGRAALLVNQGEKTAHGLPAGGEDLYGPGLQVKSRATAFSGEGHDSGKVQGTNPELICATPRKATFIFHLSNPSGSCHLHVEPKRP